MTTPYNPLDKLNLAQSIERELLSAPRILLASTQSIVGAGVYAIYYDGPFPAYAPISASAGAANERPIYVGKAIPKGGRRGGLSLDASTGRALAERLGIHAMSIVEAHNLDISHFSARYLVVEDIWIPLGENMLIERFRPVWNVVAPGFGNKAPGRGRPGQKMSMWDTLHPGRGHSVALPQNTLSTAEIQDRVVKSLAGQVVPLVEENEDTEDD